MKIKPYVFLWLIIPLIIQAKNLTLDDAVALAISNNLDFSSKQIEQKSNQWKMYTLWNTFLPSINLTGNLIKSNKNEDDRTTLGIPDAYDTVVIKPYSFTQPEWAAALGFDLTWTFNAAMIFAAYQTTLDYQKGVISIEEAKSTLIKNVTQSYYGLLLQKEELEIKKNITQAKKDRYEQAKINFNNGLIPRLTLLRVQVAYETAIPEVKEKENIYKNTLSMFHFLLGIDEEEELVLVDSFPSTTKVVPDYEEIIKKFNKHNNTLRSLYIAKNMVHNSTNLAMSALTPSFQLSYTNSPTFLKDPMKDPWFDNVDKDWKDMNGNLRLTLIMPISEWIPFSKNQVNIIGSQYAKTKMDQDIQAFIQVSHIQIRNIIRNLEKAIQNIQSMELSVAVADEAYKIAKEEYRLGTKVLLDVQETENDLLNFKLFQLYAEYEYYNGILELENLINNKILN